MKSSNPQGIRRVIAEDSDWDLFIVSPLSDICVATLIKSFSSYPLLKELSSIDVRYAKKLIEGLPTNLPLSISVSLIDNQSYWKNKYLARWEFCENIGSQDSWKKLYLERNLGELIEK
ncbi:hypothetical protein LOD99_15105 [Oopsacas minuta]|uniref:Uncharacterized protein n=1 Tax=Oopsacas minuta TaxID=111878 RepID=A0AAV7KDL1_9METZ|nr:hypothetical protein LOD99_15105 [Oopsacas minuta]